MNVSGRIIYDCTYHVVFCTKYRRSVLVDGVDIELKRLLSELSESSNDFTVVESEVTPDHVHLVVECDPRRGIHSCVSFIKGKLSYNLRRDFPWLKSRLPSLWTRSYYVGTTGGVSLDRIKEYVRSQKGV